MAIMPDFSQKVVKDTLNLSDGTTLVMAKPPGYDDASWEETKKMMEMNPEEGRRMEEFQKDAKALRDNFQQSALADYYYGKLGQGDEYLTNKIYGLETHPDFLHIFEDIKRGGPQAAMQYYYNEPLMLKISRAVGGIPEELHPELEQAKKQPFTIQEACKMGVTKDVQDYIAAGSDVEEKDSKGIGCLAYAVGANRPEVVKILLDAKADPKAVDTSGGSALHYAAAYGRKEMLEFLLGVAGDVNKKNLQGQTPLAVATKNKQTATIDLLKAKGGTM